MSHFGCGLVQLLDRNACYEMDRQDEGVDSMMDKQGVDTDVEEVGADVEQDNKPFREHECDHNDDHTPGQQRKVDCL